MVEGPALGKTKNTPPVGIVSAVLAWLLQFPSAEQVTLRRLHSDPFIGRLRGGVLVLAALTSGRERYDESAIIEIARNIAFNIFQNRRFPVSGDKLPVHT